MPTMVWRIWYHSFIQAEQTHARRRPWMDHDHRIPASKVPRPPGTLACAQQLWLRDQCITFKHAAVQNCEQVHNKKVKVELWTLTTSLPIMPGLHTLELSCHIVFF